MNNYPDDIRSYDNDPRSPFYDTTWDDFVGDFEGKLAIKIDDLICSFNFTGVEVLLKDETGIEIIFLEWAYDFAADESIDISYGGIEVHAEMFATKLVESLHTEIVEYLEDG